jgi:hypothetical protein
MPTVAGNEITDENSEEEKDDIEILAEHFASMGMCNISLTELEQEIPDDSYCQYYETGKDRVMVFVLGKSYLEFKFLPYKRFNFCSYKRLKL